MKIPNAILSLVTGNSLKVACKLYSLVNPIRRSRNGYEVCIKQSTLAKACGLSVSTVKRALAELVDKKVITNRYRITYKNGHQGCYHYSMAVFNKYFFMRYDIFRYSLTAQEFTLYAAMCKLRTNSTSSFYQSLNDLQEITGIDKSNICKIYRSLAAHGLVAKQLKRTKLGDYTDNTYFVVVRLRGTLKKKTPKLFKHIIPLSKSFVNRVYVENFVKCLKKAKKGVAFYYTRGSG